jgi:outer membrane protein assembly factor BamB
VRVGKGGTLGGIEWGSATDQSNVYVALSDIGRIVVPGSFPTEADPKQGGGMFALNLEKGERVWYTPPPGCGERKRCSPAQSAAVSGIPGVAFSGSVDGHALTPPKMVQSYGTLIRSVPTRLSTVLKQKVVHWTERARLSAAGCSL